MFDWGYQVRFSNCKALVRVLYSDLDLSHFPPFGMEVAKLIMELTTNPSLCLDMRHDTSHCGVSS